MTTSFSEPSALTCPSCDREFVGEVWLILDPKERPDLLQLLLRDALHTVGCPHCGTRGPLDAPLLICRPGQVPPLIFSPAQQTSQAEDRQMLNGLLQTLRERVGTHWRMGWLQGLVAVSRPDLSRALAPGAGQTTGPAAFNGEELLAQLRQADANFQRYMQTSDDAALDAALQTWGRILSRSDMANIPPEAQAFMCNNASVVYLQVYLDRGADRDLETAISLCERGLHLFPAASNQRAPALNNLGNVLRTRFTRYGREEDLEAAIDAFERASQLAPERSPDRAGALGNLGMALTLRFKRAGALSDASGAIGALEAALREAPEGFGGHPGLLDGLGTALRDRFLSLGDRRDLDRAVEAHKQAVGLSRTGARQISGFLSNLGNALRRRYDAYGRAADLDEAIQAHERAIALIRPDSTKRPGYLHNLGNCRALRHSLLGRIEDLEASLEAHDDAVASSPLAAPERLTFLASLGETCRERYERMGRGADLDRSIEALGAVSEASEPGSMLRSTAQCGLANAARLRFERDGRDSDLQWSLSLCRSADAALPEGAPEQASVLGTLGNTLSALYTQTGDPALLDEAVACLRRAATQQATGAPERARTLNNLGKALWMRHSRTGAANDLREAIAQFELALATLPAGSPERAAALNNLGASLADRYDQHQEPRDLEQACRNLEEAVREARSLHRALDLAAYLSNLGTALEARFNRTGELPELDTAVAVMREALHLHPSDSPDQPSLLNNLGTCLLTLAQRRRSLEDVMECVAVLEQAVHLSPEGAPGLSGRLTNLGNALRLRAEVCEQVADREAAKEAYRRACELGIELHPESAVLSAWAWAGWAAERNNWGEAVDATTYGLQASKLLHRAQLLRQDKEHSLMASRGMFTLAALARARQGDLRGSVLALELGRARLLTEALERDRAQLGQARALDPEAVQAYEDAAARLRVLEKKGAPGAPQLLPCQAPGLDARAQLDTALARIRQLPGFERFLEDPTFEELAEGLEQEVPVVYLSITEHGCLGLMLLAHGAQVEVEQIHGLALSRADLLQILFDPAPGRASGGWFGAWKQIHDAGTSGEAVGARLRWAETLRDALDTLWRGLMGPVVAKLEAHEITEAVLVPGDLLGLLPLHAAAAPSSEPRSALDRVAFRYAPSLRAMAHAQRLAAVLPAERLLVIADPQPSSAPPLPCAKLEAEAVCGMFAEPVMLLHGAATRAAVLDGLDTATVAHFACHGISRWHHPLSSGLELAHDQELTVRDLLQVQHPGARLAVLSACRTAVIGSALPDEMIALSTAFLQAGFAGVLGSLWAVSDLSTALLMIRFFELWKGQGARPAIALQRAQRWMRDTLRTEKQAYFERLATEDQGSTVGVPSAVAAELATLLELGVGLAGRESDEDLSHPADWAAFTFTGV